MKKLFLSILAVAALASCSKNEVIYTEVDSEIKLAPVASIATKANVLQAIDGTTYPTKENFDVYAYWKNVDAGQMFKEGTDYLKGEGSGVEFVNKGAYWGGTTTYYWPKNGSLRFAAYSPSSIDMTHDLATDTYSVENYEQPSNTANTWDLLVAPTSESYTAETATENVSVVFEHALSWITLKVKAKDAAAAAAFDIKELIIDNVITKANLDAVMTGEDKAFNWELSTVATDKAGYKVYAGSQLVTVTATVIESTSNGTLVIPQPTTTVTVNYTQNALEGTPELPNQSVTVPLVLDADNTPWEAGKHYTYTLIFGLDEILINPSVEDWKEVEVGDIDTDKNTNNVSTAAQLTEAVAQGGKVVLQNDITLVDVKSAEASPCLVVTKDLVVDLNGYNITAGLFAESNGAMNAGNTDSYVFWVKKGANLTINGNGTVESQSAKYSMAVWADGGTVIINGGTYKNAGEGSDLIYAKNGGKVVITGGEFIACEKQNNTEGTLEKYSALNLNDKTAGNVIEVSGGRYFGFNPAQNKSENPAVSFVKEGYTVVKDGDYYEVVPAEDFAELLAAGGEFVLYNDLNILETIEVTSDLTIDLNGKTITNASGNTTTDVFVVKPSAKLTVNGEGTIEAVSGNDGYAIISEGTVEINGGTIKSGLDANGAPNAVIYARGNGKVYVKGGYFPNDNTSKFVLNKKDADRSTTTIEVSGGTFGAFNPGNNAAENPGTNFLATGYKSVETAEGSNIWTVVAE